MLDRHGLKVAGSIPLLFNANAIAEVGRVHNLLVDKVRSLERCIENIECTLKKQTRKTKTNKTKRERSHHGSRSDNHVSSRD